MTDWWTNIATPLLTPLSPFNYLELKSAIFNFPSSYLHYIQRLYAEHPEHVIVETFLITFVLYITFVKKSYDPSTKEKPLSEDEITNLCNEWEPEPLLPSSLDTTILSPRGIITQTPDTYLHLEGEKKPLLNLTTFDFLGIGTRKEMKERVKNCLEEYGCGSCGPRK